MTSAGGRAIANDARVDAVDHAGPRRDPAEEARCLAVLAAEAEELLAGAERKLDKAKGEVAAAKEAVAAAKDAVRETRKRADDAAQAADGSEG